MSVNLKEYVVVSEGCFFYYLCEDVSEVKQIFAEEQPEYRIETIYLNVYEACEYE